MPRQSLIFASEPDHSSKVKREIEEKPKETKTQSINDCVLELATLAREIHQREKPQGMIKFGTSLSFVAYAYEQVRNVLDNKSDHLLRRNAIERIVRRLLWENPKTSPAEVGKQLTKELIWSRFLPNATVSQKALQQISDIVSKYESLIDKNALFQSRNASDQLILAVMSAEIEEVLDPALLNAEQLAQTMEDWLSKTFDWQDPSVSQEKKELLLFVAVRKILNRHDNARIAYQLLKKTFPHWQQETARTTIKMAGEVSDIANQVNKIQLHPLFNKLYRFLSKHTAQFLILKDLVDKHPENFLSLIENKEEFDKEALDLIRHRYAEIKSKITTGIIRSVLYIFISKVLFVLVLEIPYELIVASRVNYVTLSTNLALPPLLMFLVGLTITKPNERNTQTILTRLHELISKAAARPSPLFLDPPSSSTTLGYIFDFLYLVFVGVVFTAIIAILTTLHFNLMAILVFFLFLSLVLLFGFRVGFAATELYVEDQKKNLFSRILEQLSLPFLNLGVYLSRGLDKLNFLTIVMDILFEVPLKTIIDIVNRWGEFISNKRAEIVEVPIQ